MKQRCIKAGRSYAGTNLLHVRHVVEEGVDDVDVKYVVWRPPNDFKGAKEKDQPLQSFAQWASTEVRPVYDEVIRCPDCDTWEWLSHTSGTRAECRKCETSWHPITGKVICHGK